MLLVLFSFILAFCIDIIFIWYYQAINDNRPLLAANLSVAIVICSLFGSWLLIDKEWVALVAYIVVGYIGTYLAVKGK